MTLNRELVIIAYVDHAWYYATLLLSLALTHYALNCSLLRYIEQHVLVVRSNEHQELCPFVVLHCFDLLLSSAYLAYHNNYQSAYFPAVPLPFYSL